MYLGVLHHLLDRIGIALHLCSRHRLGGEKGVPTRSGQVHARFLQGGHLRHGGVACIATHRQNAQLARIVLLHQGVERIDCHRHLPAHQIGQQRR